MKPKIVIQESVGAGRGGSPLRILLVEDNPVNQRVEMTLLLKEGYVVDLAEDGSEALAAVGQTTYDLILMDIQMPVMDGLAATTAIRANEARTGGRRVPIIAVTARAMKGDREQCIQIGMDDYITKPVTRGDLYRVIQKWRPKDVGARRPSPSSERAPDPPAPALPDDGDHQAIIERLRELGMLEDPEVVREMMDTFLADASRLVTGLTGALSARDTNSSQTLAHSLKGISLNVGAGRLADLAKTIEDCIQAVDLSDAADAMDSLLCELEEVRTFANSIGETVLRSPEPGAGSPEL